MARNATIPQLTLFRIQQQQRSSGWLRMSQVTSDHINSGQGEGSG